MITSLQLQQIPSHLYNACDDTVQNTIINTYTDLDQDLDEERALQVIESIVTGWLSAQ